MHFEHGDAAPGDDGARRVRRARRLHFARRERNVVVRRQVQLALLDLRGVGDLLLVLLRPLGSVALDVHEGSEQGVRAQVGQLIGKLGGAFAVDDGGAAHAVGTCVQALLHAHDAHARLLVARQDGSLDGRGAAPARQQRRVHVEAAEARDVEHLLRQDGAVGRDADHVGGERGQLALRRLVAQGARSQHAQAAALGRGLHRRGL